MNRNYLHGACLIIALGFGAPVFCASDTIAYQGVLVDSAGNPVADASYEIRFQLFAAPAGGSALWSEIHLNVPVIGGVFSVELGMLSPFQNLFSNNALLFLQMRANTGNGLQTYSPRVVLTAAPYALSASDSDRLNGQTPAQFLDTVTDAFTGEGTSSTISGGLENAAVGEGAVVGGGANNTVFGDYGTVSGGGGVFGTTVGNIVFDDGGTIGGGDLNRVGTQNGNPSDSPFGTVGGGYGNSASGEHAVISGGINNTAGGSQSAVGGGISNTASASLSTIGGGSNNLALGSSSTVGGGSDNAASGSLSTVAGGLHNTATGNFSFAAGRDSDATADYAFAMGRNALANGQGSFCWADSNTNAFSAGVNQFFARASGGFFMATNAAGNVGAFLGAGAGTWTNLSDRHAKKVVEPVDPGDILERVAAMPITEWSYETEGGVRHMGPMAQDFFAAFGLGADEKGITTIDGNGVALAAIQGLNQKIEAHDSEVADRDAELARQDTEIDTMKRRIDDLERLVRGLAKE